MSSPPSPPVSITDVRVILPSHDDNPRVLGYCSVVLCGAIILREMRLIDGDNGLFLAMPNLPSKRGCSACRRTTRVNGQHCDRCGAVLPEYMADQKRWFDVVHPLSPAVREAITDAVVHEWRAAMAAREARWDDGGRGT